MDDNKRKLILIVGGVIALAILGIVLFTFLGGDEESPPPPPPPAAVEELSETAQPVMKEPEPVKKLAELLTDTRTTLQSIAAREDVYGDAEAWWTLFAANPEAVRYLFKDDMGTYSALVQSGTLIKIPEKREVSPTERAKLQRGFGAYAVQLGSYSEPANATALSSVLERGEPNMDFYVSRLTVDGIPRQRIRAGLFSRWIDAERYGRSADQRYDEVKDYYVVSVPDGERRAQERALGQRYR